MKTSEMMKALKKSGCYYLRSGGRHEIWYSPVTQREFEVPRHKSKELPKGTAEAIKKEAGLK